MTSAEIKFYYLRDRKCTYCDSMRKVVSSDVNSNVSDVPIVVTHLPIEDNPDVISESKAMSAPIIELIKDGQHQAWVSGSNPSAFREAFIKLIT